MMIYNHPCLQHHEAGHLSFLKHEGLQSKVLSVNQNYNGLHRQENMAHLQILLL